jgi:type VI secretion system secreted protein VgrG
MTAQQVTRADGSTNGARSGVRVLGHACKLWIADYSGPDLAVSAFTIHEGISELFDVSVLAFAEQSGEVDFEQIVGKAAAFTFDRGGGEAWSGICAGMTADAAGYRLRILPDLWRTTLRKNSRVFQHATIQDIVGQVLDEWGIRWKITNLDRKLPKHEYRVQYAESDFAFVSRLLEEAGIAYYFSHARPSGGLDISTLVLDAAPHNNPTTGVLQMVVDQIAPSATPPAFATHAAFVQDVVPGAVTVRDFDFRRRPDQALVKSASEGREAAFEQYEYWPGAAVVEQAGTVEKPIADKLGARKYDEAEAQAMASRHLTAIRRARRAVGFETNAREACPGAVVSIHPPLEKEAAPMPKFDLGKLLVVESTIHGSVGDQSFLRECRAVSAGAAFAPEPRTPKPRVGMQSALVVGPPDAEIHCDELGRVRVQFHWDRDHKYGAQLDGAKNLEPLGSCWVRVAHAWAGGGYGFVAIPRVGHEVLVDFFEGDPDSPVIVGSVYNQTSPTPYKLPEHQTQTGLRTDSSPKSGGYNEIMFDDAKGKELIRVQAERNVEKIVKVDEGVSIGQHRTTLIGHTENTEIGDHYALIVGKDNGVRVSKDHTIVIQAGQASVVLTDGHIYLNAAKSIQVHAGQDLILNAMNDVRIAGKMVYINCDGPTGPTLGAFGEARPPLPGQISQPGLKPSGGGPAGKPPGPLAPDVKVGPT